MPIWGKMGNFNQIQCHHGIFLAEKTITVAATSLVCSPFWQRYRPAQPSVSQNLDKTLILIVLSPVAALRLIYEIKRDI